MSSKVLLTIASGLDNADAVKLQTVTGKHEALRKVLNFVESVGSGNQLAYSRSGAIPPSVLIENQASAVQASGTFTLTAVIATDAVSINGVTFTAVASGAGANQFNVGVSDTATAVNLAAAINASVSGLVAGYVTASAALTVVTVSSTSYGIMGNQTLIASADATIVASGARLTGGLADAAALTLNF